MWNLIFFIILQAILLHFSLKLEIETTGKDSKEYRSLRNVCGGGLIMMTASLFVLLVLGYVA